MINIIKAQNYQTVKDNMLYYVLLPYFVLIMILMVYAGNGTGLSMSGAEYFSSAIEGKELIALFVAMILISRIVGFDYKDKNINYEITAGHSRLSVFFGRVLVGMFWGVIVNFLILMLPVIIVTITNGWGVEVKASEAVVRSLLALLSLIRLSALFILFVTITKRTATSVLLGYVSLMLLTLVSVIAEFAEKSVTWQLGYTCLLSLFVPENSKNIILNGVETAMVDMSLSKTFVIGTVALGVVMTVIYIGAAYMFFKKKDRD